MHPPVSTAKWAAIRAVCEGGAPTSVLIGAATGLHPVTIRERARLEGWATLDFRSARVRQAYAERDFAAATPAADLPDGWQVMNSAERLTWLNDFVARQLAQIAAAADSDGGSLDKARMDALWSMIRMVERSETLAQERAVKQETDSDADLAAKLRLLDDRIIELARAHAAWLVAEGLRARDA